jgi:hypothetical protein
LADLHGGLEVPVFADVPGVADTDAGYDEAEETLDEISLETEETFDIDEAMKIDVIDDEL